VTLIEILFVVALVLLVTPWIVYLSVKLGVFAFYRGRQLFEQYEEGRKNK